MGSPSFRGSEKCGKIEGAAGVGWTGGSPGGYVEPLVDSAEPPAPGPLLFPLNLPVF